LKILRHAQHQPTQHQPSIPIHLLILPYAWRKQHVANASRTEPALGPLAAALTVAVTLGFLWIHHVLKARVIWQRKLAMTAPLLTIVIPVSLIPNAIGLAQGIAGNVILVMAAMILYTNAVLQSPKLTQSFV